MAVIQFRAEMVRSRTVTEPSEDAENMRLINKLTQSELSRDQVYIRSMYLCSSQLCETDWCRFTEQALEQIAEKVVGESVLAGHDKHSLPVARFFKAKVVDRPEVPDDETGEPTRWVRAWFYWLKETDGARDLALNMDGGIYREVSISWRYAGGKCSICGQASHTCPHIPGETYDGNRCFIWIEEILEVLEGSLVYRGADRETSIVGEHDGSENVPVRGFLHHALGFELGPVEGAGR